MCQISFRLNWTVGLFHFFVIAFLPPTAPIAPAAIRGEGDRSLSCLSGGFAHYFSSCTKDFFLFLLLLGCSYRAGLGGVVETLYVHDIFGFTNKQGVTCSTDGTDS